MCMEVIVCECPVATCRYRWKSRVSHPKECPSCKHRFDSNWGLALITRRSKVSSVDDLKKLKKELDEWNAKGRFS